MSTPEPLEAFFQQFSTLGFGYRPSKTAHSNFRRLHKVFGWEEDSEEAVVAQIRFDNALVQQFHFVFGMGSNLESWQKLCSFIDITPVPDTMRECRKLVREAHINIVDLVESARTGKKVQKFPNLEKLRAYTIKQKKIFPKKDAQGLLRDLLREIFSGYEGKRGGGRRRRKARKQAAPAQPQSA